AHPLFSAQETVDRLLRLHLRDGRIRVNGDAQLLMAEMLKVFVRAGPAAAASCSQKQTLTPCQGIASNISQPPLTLFACPVEAAARAARQAQAEDLEKVDIEHVEKVLPQLVCNC
ncbi:CENPX protein, partial [Urocolius indicus]|nr:CENPX protein [Urocolius indicus]